MQGRQSDSGFSEEIGVIQKGFAEGNKLPPVHFRSLRKASCIGWFRPIEVIAFSLFQRLNSIEIRQIDIPREG
jgi:hypothetical protein